LKVLELFCGIGGCAAALGRRADVVAAVDQNRVALDVYAHNFPHPVLPLAIENIPGMKWREWADAAWWMSPPCSPYTRRGLRRDLDDPRARSLVAVIGQIAALHPPYVALENVPGFEGSRAHLLLRDTLAAANYTVRETLLCPAQLGMPNRRERFYLVAGLTQLDEWPTRAGARRAVADLLDGSPDPALWCDDALARDYAGALDLVDARDPGARTACFTAAYGRSPVRSGSYLVTPSGLRRFSPGEVLRLLDFPGDYRLPATIPLRAAWRLAGNSVSVRAVRWVLAAVPGLGQPEGVRLPVVGTPRGVPSARTAEEG
jgi:site-specific DNA-cytosine methylase